MLQTVLNPLNAELNPICHLLALLGAHLFLHISRIRVKCHPSLSLPELHSTKCWTESQNRTDHLEMLGIKESTVPKLVLNKWSWSSSGSEYEQVAGCRSKNSLVSKWLLLSKEGLSPCTWHNQFVFIPRSTIFHRSVHSLISAILGEWKCPNIQA